MSAPTRPIRVALVNDYEIIVNGLAHMLEPFGDRIQVVETTARGVPSHPADIALFDNFGNSGDARHRIDAMAGDRSIARVVLYTWDIPSAFVADPAIDAIILKSTSARSLVEELERVHSGDCLGPEPDRDPDRPVDGESVDARPSQSLTEREREVLALIARGMTNREIAGELYLSLDTVKTHTRKLFRKLDVVNRTQAALHAADHGLVLATTNR